jgi:hypothetical protein
MSTSYGRRAIGAAKLHAAASERAWLRLFEGDELMFVETVIVGKSASTRAEFLRSLFCGPHKTKKTRTSQSRRQ